MKNSQESVMAARSWYVVWAGLLAASVANAMTSRGAAKWVLLTSVVLAIAAATQASIWRGALGRRDRALAWWMLAMFCTGQLLHFAIVQAPPPVKFGFDFSAYYLAGKVAGEKPAQSMYDLPVFADGRMNLHTLDGGGTKWHATAMRDNVPYAAPFIYPPFLAVLMKPFVHLSFAHALAVWNVMTVLLAAWAVVLSFSLAGVRLDARLALIVGVGLLSFYPLLDNLYCGQIGGVLLFLFAAGVWLLRRGQTWLSALCFAAATLIKLTPIVVVPLLIFHRRWRWLAAYGIWMVALAEISARVTGWASYAEFWRVVLPAISCGSPAWENSSLVSWIQQLFLGYTPHAVDVVAMIPAYACEVSKLISMAVYGVFLLVCWLRRKEQSVEREMIAMVLLSLAISPITWWHHYMLALLPLVYLWWTMRDGPGRRAVAALGLVVGTNFVVVIGLIWQATPLLRVLAAVTPVLTIAVAFAAVMGKADDTSAVLP